MPVFTCSNQASVTPTHPTTQKRLWWSGNNMQCYDVMAPPPPYSSCSGRPPPCCPSPAPCTGPGRRPRPAAALRPPGLGRVCRPDSRGSLHDKEGTLRTRPRSRPGSDSAPYLKKGSKVLKVTVKWEEQLWTPVHQHLDQPTSPSPQVFIVEINVRFSVAPAASLNAPLIN